MSSSPISAVGNGQRQLLFREANYKSRGALKPQDRLMFELLRQAAGT
ncbi:hypothetical protein LADH09A_001822 [Micromonospora sp. LAH09]|nr:hypothetical protein [Micromonospora cabrerizensis]MCG5467972.1 hypothetical protein [Micromonospora cabrerizensis]